MPVVWACQSVLWWEWVSHTTEHRNWGTWTFPV